MKKLLSLALIGALMLSLTACNSNDDDDDSSRGKTGKDNNISNSWQEDNDVLGGLDDDITSEEHHASTEHTETVQPEETKKCVACGTTSGVDYIMETWVSGQDVCFDCFTEYSVCSLCNDASRQSAYREELNKYYCDECYKGQQVCIVCCSKDAEFYGRYYYCAECYNQYN